MNVAPLAPPAPYNLTVYSIDNIGGHLFLASRVYTCEYILSEISANFEFRVNQGVRVYISELGTGSEELHKEELEVVRPEWGEELGYALLSHTFVNDGCKSFALSFEHDATGSGAENDPSITVWIYGDISATTSEEVETPIYPTPENPSVMASIKIDASMSISEIIEQHNKMHGDASLLFSKLK